MEEKVGEDDEDNVINPTPGKLELIRASSYLNVCQVVSKFLEH